MIYIIFPVMIRVIPASYDFLTLFDLWALKGSNFQAEYRISHLWSWSNSKKNFDSQG